MPELIDPTARLGDSFAEAVEEFIAEGRGRPGDDSLTGLMISRYARDSDGRDWLDRYLADERRWRTEPPEGFVPMHMLWWVEDRTYLGRISIRHRLNDNLREVGGHIGYDIRPSARRQGHGTALLAAALPRAAALGIERALITCDAGNVGSRKIIERNGGVFEDQRGDKLRYWAPTVSLREGPSAATGRHRLRTAGRIGCADRTGRQVVTMTTRKAEIEVLARLRPTEGSGFGRAATKWKALVRRRSRL